VEPPSVADVHNLKEVTDIHRLLLGADIIIVEGLTNLEAIQTDCVWLMALPLKIGRGDGAPARVVAFEMG
jgi:kynurenine formamidase